MTTPALRARWAASGVFGALALAVALPAAAQFKKPDDAVEYRKSAFTVMGHHFGRIGAMATGKMPYDAKVAASDAEIVKAMSTLPFTAFLAGTENIAHTEAKPLVWKEPQKFKDATEKMVVAVNKLSDVAKAGNLDQLKAAFGDAAKTCKGCHEDFRQD